MNLDLLEERTKTPDLRLRIQFDRKEVESFARRQWKKSKRSNRWNGRQIKNAFQTAVALADWDNITNTGGVGNPEGTILKIDHFEKVAVTSGHFDMYMEQTRRSDHQRALEDEARDDTIGYKVNLRSKYPSESGSGSDSESDSVSDSDSEPNAKSKIRGKSSKKSSTKKSKLVKGKKKSKQTKRNSKSESEEGSSEESL